MRNECLVIVLLWVLAACPCLGGDEAEEVASFAPVVKLTASDAEAGAEFGYAVSVSGDNAIVGAPFDSELGAASGAAYIFKRRTRPQDTWGEVAKLTAPDGGRGDWLGSSVGIDDDTAIVGALVYEFSRPGFAYIFERDVEGDGAWIPVAKLVGDIDDPSDGFGGNVAISGDRAIVSASLAEEPDGLGGGAVYVYERTAGGPDSWGQVAKLRPASACEDWSSYCGWRGDKYFGGSSIRMDGDTIVVGGTGSSGEYAYVFQRQVGGVWSRDARLLPAGRVYHYGASVAVSGDTVFVGDYGDHDLGTQSGAAYVFDLGSPVGRLPRRRELAKLTAPGGDGGDHFGLAVDLGGDTAVIGAPQRGLGGEAFVFQRDPETSGVWRAVANLRADDAEAYDDFGNSVAVAGDTVFVSAPEDDDFGTASGAVYVFQVSEATTASSLSAVRDNELVGRIGSSGSPSLAAGTEESERFSGLHDALPQGTSLCFDFGGQLKCDALELTVSGDTVRGTWSRFYGHQFCDYFEVAVSGTVADGSALVVCDAATDPCPLGMSWAWEIDLPIDSTMVMVQKRDGLWQSWFDEIGYLYDPGPCVGDLPGGAPVRHEVAKLLASDGAVWDHFGESLAIEGDTLVVGASRRQVSEVEIGTAYIFERDAGGRWAEVGKLWRSDGAEDDYFGESLAISGETLAVGASGDDTLASNSGAVYVYRRNEEGAWVEATELLASDGGYLDRFGGSLALSGDTLAVSAGGYDHDDGDSGAIYVFERGVRGSWTETGKLYDAEGGVADAALLSLTGTTAVAGAWSADELGEDSGVAYVFERDGTGRWVEVAKLLPSDGTAGQWFGSSAANWGTTVVVGAPNDDGVASLSGAAYVFERDDVNGWVEVAKLVASDAQQYTYFGSSATMTEDTLLVGASQDDSGDGSVYVFKRDAVGGWVELGKLKASDAWDDDRFAGTLAVAGDRAIVGAYADDDLGYVSGSAYVFALRPCVLDLVLKRSTVRAGDELAIEVSLEHNRPDDVNEPFRLWLEDAQGNVRATWQSPRRRVRSGETIRHEDALPLPLDLSPGYYQLMLEVDQMLQGTARVERSLRVVPQ